MHNFGGRQVIRKGTWSDDEDTLLRNCIDKYGEGNWHQVPVRAGLNRCRKSCRLRWLNYLKPNIKRGQFNEDEIDLIMRLHKLLGNRWSLIAGRIPGRTANDVKNYWNTHMLKSGTPKQNINKNKQSNNNKKKNRKAETIIIKISSDGKSRMQKTKVIRPKARVILKSKTSVVVGDDQEQYYYGTSSVPPPLAYDIMYWPSDDNNDSNNITTPIIPVHDDHDDDSSLLSYFDDNLWV